MQIPKPSDADKAYFRSLVPEGPGVEVKPMFGNLGAFVNGNMFMGLFGSQVGVRLSPDDAACLLDIEGAGPFGPAERPVGGDVTVPAAMRDTAESGHWVTLRSGTCGGCRRRYPSRP
jgi:hypothetical protein